MNIRRVPPIVAATFQATLLSAGSNVVGQYVNAYRQGVPFVFSSIQLVRFIAVTILTVPPNYLWQIWLEKAFPSRPGKGAYNTRSSKYPAVEEYDLEGTVLGAGKTEGEEDAKLDEPGPISIRNTFLKWFIDCMTIGALVNTVLFLGLMAILKGEGQERALATIQRETIPLILASYRFWPIISVVNFTLIPVERRILFLSTMSFLWSIFMSIVAARV